MTTREHLKEHIGNIAFQSLLNCLEKKHGGYSRNDAKELERGAQEIATTVISHNQSERQQAVEDFSARLKGNTFPLWLKNHQVDDFIALIDQAKEEYKEDQE